MTEVQYFFQTTVLSHKGPGCLIWPYARDLKGYGRMNYLGKNQRVSRLVCRMVHGEPPSPIHQAAHACGNRACVSPRHLSWKTQSENEADKLIHGTHSRGERSKLSKLTAEDVVAIRSAKGVTQRELANRFGVSRGYVAGLRRGRFWPDLHPDTMQLARSIVTGGIHG